MKPTRSSRRHLCPILLLLLALLCIPQTASAADRPGKVKGLKCGEATASSINISWSAQRNVTGYQILRSSSYDGPYKKIKSISADNCAFCNMNLAGGREYYYRVRAVRGSSVGRASKILAARTTSSPYTAAVRVSSNIRKHAGTNHDILTTLSPGTKVTVICTTYAKSGTPWKRISFQSGRKKKSGYIQSSLLSSESQQPQKRKGTVTANGGLHLRKSPSSQSKTIAILPKGTAVTILSGTVGTDGQKWYRVSAKRNGRKKKGYVFAKYIRVLH